MPMTVVVTRDVAPRFRGFLASVMLEIAPGVYTSPTLTKGVRERIWTVLSDWHRECSDGSIVMTWRDIKASGRQTILTLGLPPQSLVDYEGLVLVKRAIAPQEVGSLKCK
jgi:CRISPR-associated protein Cas2